MEEITKLALNSIKQRIEKLSIGGLEQYRLGDSTYDIPSIDVDTIEHLINIDLPFLIEIAHMYSNLEH